MQDRENADHDILIDDEDSKENVEPSESTVLNDLEMVLVMINEKLKGLHEAQSSFLKWTGGSSSLIGIGSLIYGLLEKSIGTSVFSSLIFLGGLGLVYTSFKPNSWLYRKILHVAFSYRTANCEYIGLPNIQGYVRIAGALSSEEKKQITHTIEKYNGLELLESKDKITASLEKIDYTKLRGELLIAIENKNQYHQKCTDSGARFLHEAKTHLFFTKNIPATIVHPILEYLDCPDPNQLLKKAGIN